MCGICGKVGFDGVERADIEVMMEPLTHRGPDGHGAYLNGIAGLGHRRLSIIDLQTGGQPITNDFDKTYTAIPGSVFFNAQYGAQGNSTLVTIKAGDGEKQSPEATGLWSFKLKKDD